jgi:hypothetical protein
MSIAATGDDNWLMSIVEQCFTIISLLINVLLLCYSADVFCILAIKFCVESGKVFENYFIPALF